MKRDILNPGPELHATFEEIARDILWIDTLETHDDEAADNHVVTTGCVCEAFRRVYELGRRHEADAS